MGIDIPVTAAPHPSRPPRRRGRRVVVIALAAVTAVLVLGGGVAGALWVRADVQTVGRTEFVRPLLIPPLLEGERTAGGVRTYDLDLRAGQTEFTPGVASPTWGINGGYLGPTLRMRRGETVRMTVRNGLPEATALHWHGMLLPARMDGGPHTHIAPGATWTPTWQVDQPAATLWYHAHQHGETLDHVRRGLAGMLLVDDPAAAPAGLPTAYGRDDIPVVVQDARLDGGRLTDGSSLLSGVGPLGDTLLVNGTVAPYLEVATEHVRLRLLNASVGRTYNFMLADRRPMLLVGTDGGLLAAPHSTTAVQLSPAERAEVVVTLRPGERIALRSERPELAANVFGERFSGGADRLDVLELRAAQRLAPSPQPATRLTDLPAATVPGGAATRSFALSGRDINGAQFDVERVDVTAEAGATEVWEVRNDGGPHSFHVHGVQFRVLSLGGSPAAPGAAGWKDTLYVPPGRTARLLVTLPRHPDARMPYLFHCHLLDHEDAGMSGQLVVVRPGEQPHVHTHGASSGAASGAAPRRWVAHLAAAPWGRAAHP